METIKKPYIEIIYNKKNITADISKYILSLTYTDYESGESDELEVTLNDNENLFKSSWQPQKGDKISAKIGYTGEELLNCGTFTVDEGTMDSSDDGDTYIIRTLAASINNKIREKNNKPYEGKTLIQIAKEIGKKHGFTVAGKEGFIKIPREAQRNESDLAFLHRLAQKYGYLFKLNDTVLTFTKMEALEETKALSTIKRNDIKHISLNDTSTKTYNACSVKYKNPKTGKMVSYTAKNAKDGVKAETLKINRKCQTKEQAMTVANAGLKNGQNTIEGSVDLKSGNSYFIAGVNFNLEDYFNFNGKYHITKSIHTVTPDDYSCNGEVKKIA
ncbi:MAG: contractile injection system protein, VgrG/Pvc8 family [Candidatus Gastranaerophilales bacterium]|nr:contractile injection system protein, VgrG/Pvc8 family [Candidatus Gastranaerophilales bacterium]